MDETDTSVHTVAKSDTEDDSDIDDINQEVKPTDLRIKPVLLVPHVVKTDLSEPVMDSSDLNESFGNSARVDSRDSFSLNYDASQSCSLNMDVADSCTLTENSISDLTLMDRSADSCALGPCLTSSPKIRLKVLTFVTC